MAAGRVGITPDPGGGLRVALPTPVRRFVRQAALDVGREVAGPEPGGEAGGAGAGAPVGSGPGAPDAAMETARREAARDAVATVTATWRSAHLDRDQGEAWLQVLGMALSGRAGRLGLTTEDQVDTLGRRDRAALELIQVLQVLLVQALDPPDGP